MKIRKIGEGVYVAEFDKRKTLIPGNKPYQKIMDISEAISLGTYGGVNTDVLYQKIKESGFEINREEICASDDDDIELRMPKFWPINFGPHSLSNAMYYIKEQMRYTSGFDSFPEWNRNARDQLGWISLLEVYDIEEVVKDLNIRRVDHFSTPRTLMECVRYLEGWRLDRLKDYAGLSNEIEIWAKKQEFYDSSEWHLGRKESKDLMKKKRRKTNVRLCVNKYWKQILLKRGFSKGDRELDILSSTYENERYPKLILVGEDFFPLDGRFTDIQGEQTITFQYNFKDIRHVVPIKKEDLKNKPLINAKLIREKYPKSNVVLMTYGTGSGKLFKLIKEDGVKEGQSEEVVNALSAITHFSLKPELVGGLEKCLK